LSSRSVRKTAKAIFENIDSEVAADALSEIDPTAFTAGIHRRRQHPLGFEQSKIVDEAKLREVITQAGVGESLIGFRTDVSRRTRHWRTLRAEEKMSEATPGSNRSNRGGTNSKRVSPKPSSTC